MPTREAIVDSVIPKDVPKPIPVRTISTRAFKPAPKIENGNQEGTVRTDPVAASTTPEESVRLSPQLSALARKEQAFRQRELALKQREKDLEAKLADAEQYGQLKTSFAAKDYSKAEELGMTYEEHTQFLLEKQAGEDPQTQKFKALEAEIQSLKKGQEEKATQEYEETVSAYRKELTTALEATPEFSKLKSFKETGADGKEFSAVDVALQYILDSWEEDNEEITVEQALKDTKLLFAERAKKYASLIEASEVVSDEPRKLPPPKSGVRTLTNQMQPQGNTVEPQKSLQHLSESERYAEARRRVLARRNQQGT